MKPSIRAGAAWRAARAAAVVLAAAACGGGSGAGGAAPQACAGPGCGGAGPGETAAVVTSISVTPAVPSVAAGTALPFVAMGVFSDGTTRDVTALATWTTSDASVATVAAGLAVGRAPGTATITASVEGASDSTALTVTDATLVSLEVTPPTATIAKGTSAPLQAFATFSDGSAVDVSDRAEWSSDSNAVGVSLVRGQPVAEGLAEGSATVTAVFENQSGAASVTVTSATLTGLAVSPASATLPVGLGGQLVATGTFSDQTTQDLTAAVTWSASDGAVASVDAAGRLTALAAGEATVTATLGTVSAEAAVTVTAATLQSIVVEPATARLPAGYKLQLRATGTYSDASTHDVTAQAVWTTSRSSSASVSNAAGSQGLVAGVAAGTATLTATVGTVSGAALVQVTTAKLSSIAVAPSPFAVQAGATLQLTAVGTFDDASTLDLTRQCAWSSSAKRIARVSQAGLVTGAKRGAATITASKGGKSGPASGTVD